MNPLTKKASQTMIESKSQLHQSSISHISGFSHIKYAQKRNYFKRIKYKNLDKYRQATWDERTEFCSKFFFYVISNLINLLNIVVFIYQTYTVHIEHTYILLSHIDLACSLYFLIEYVLILYMNRKHLCKFILSFDSFIDILSIIPTIVNYFIDNATLRAVFRMVKVFRVLRIYKSLRALQYENKESIFLLFLTHFQIELIGTSLVFFSFFFISSGIILSLQDLVQGAFSQSHLSFLDAVYYMLITTSTLGYGDIYPIHLVSRMFIIFVIICFISVVSYQIGKFAQLLQLWSNYSKFSFKGHIILICNSSISIDYVLSELKRIDHRQTVLIISQDIEMLPSKEFPYNSVYCLVTQEIDLEIFERANTRSAKAILIYSNLSFRDYELSEKVNEFTLLKINEYYNLVPTYIQVLYSERSFSHAMETGRTMLVKQNITRINDLGIGGGMLKINKLIPVLRIKNMIISKASFNPGYAAFAQNLIFNNIPMSFNLEGYDLPTQAYLLGCENKIIIKKFPKYFIGKDFFQAVRMIYSKSITHYLTQISSKSNADLNRPILLIGVIDSNRTNFYSINKTVRLYPRSFRIMSMTAGVFISYDTNAYVDKIFDLFNQEPKEDEDLELGLEKDEIEKQDQSFIKTEIKSMRRQGFLELNSVINLPDKNSPDNTPNANNREEAEEENNSIHKISTRNVFLQNKTNFVTNRKQYNDITTKKNVLLLQSFDDNNLFTIESSLIQKIKKRFDSSIMTEDANYFYDNRILNISHHSYASLLNNHILIIGYQGGLLKLLKMLFFHFPNKQICILSPDILFSCSSGIDETFIKLLQQFANLYILIGRIDDPHQLINANASNAFFVIFLIESIHDKVREDTMKFLSMKTFDYFFNHKSIIEILQPASLKFFGYNIATTEKAVCTNEFLHPLFMNGRVLFVNHFNRLLSMSAQGDNMEVDAWLELISLGLKSSLSSSKRQKGAGIPLTITIDVPERYTDKEYHTLAADLICLSTPIIILGIYVFQPIEYMKLRSEGNIKQSMHDKANLNIMTSHKMYNVDELVTKNKYIKTLRRLKQLSYNDEIYLDSIDIKHPFTPIFITNPPPWFIISKGTKMLVMYNYIPQVKKKLKVFQQNLIQQLNEKMTNATEERNERRLLDLKQEYIHGMLLTLKQRFEEQFALSYKQLELKHKRAHHNNCNK